MRRRCARLCETRFLTKRKKHENKLFHLRSNRIHGENKNPEVQHDFEIDRLPDRRPFMPRYLSWRETVHSGRSDGGLRNGRWHGRTHSRVCDGILAGRGINWLVVADE